MTLEEILTNEELRNHEFPVTRDKIFLAHAADCPLTRRVAVAVEEYLRRAMSEDQETVVSGDYFRQARSIAAELLGAAPDEIAFVGPTSLALSLVANGLNLRKGDNVVVYQDDYPSNVYPRSEERRVGKECRFRCEPVRVNKKLELE